MRWTFQKLSDFHVLFYRRYIEMSAGYEKIGKVSTISQELVEFAFEIIDQFTVCALLEDNASTDVYDVVKLL